MVATLRTRLPLTRPGLFGIAATILAVLLVLGLAPVVLLLAIVVPTLWACYQRPQRAVLILAAFAPLNGLLPVLPVPSFFAGTKEFLILGTLVLSFVCPQAARAAPGRARPGWFWAIAGLVVVGFISAAFVSVPQALAGLKLSYFDLFLVIAIWRCPLDRRERDALVTIFMVFGFVTAIWGLLQQVIGYQTLASWGYNFTDNIRFTGNELRSFSTFNDPFPFAFYLMLVVLVGLSAALGDLRRIRNRLFLLTLPILGLAMLLTYVRSAWIGLAFGLAYLAFHRYKILVYLIPIAIVALLFAPGGGVGTAAFQSKSFTARTTSWSQRISRLVQHPLGGGIGSTGAAAEKAAQYQHITNATTYQPDNYYLKVAFELGVFGLWFFLMLMVSAFITARAVERRVRGPDQDFAAATAAFVLAAAIASATHTFFEIFPMDTFFWILVVCTTAMRWQHEPDPDEDSLPGGAGVAGPAPRPGLSLGSGSLR